MQETLSLLHGILLYSVALFGLCAFAGVIVSFKSKEHKVFKKRLSLLNPVYYLFFSVAAFSFIVTLALKRDFALAHGLFAVFLIIILFGGIRVYKISKNRAIFENFSSFAAKKYCCDILICAALYFIVMRDIV
ncbi:MAG: hypothetical protein LBT96_00230 [Campylobacteraceae bacterium]|jgi:hypothetical protein|nr:hypothetical protein [Campylobacteraceae bacterium]